MNLIGLGHVIPHIKLLNEESQQKMPDQFLKSVHVDALSQDTTSRKKSSVGSITDLNVLKNKINMNYNDQILEWVDLYCQGQKTASVLIAIELVEKTIENILVSNQQSVTSIPRELFPDLIQFK